MDEEVLDVMDEDLLDVMQAATVLVTNKRALAVLTKLWQLDQLDAEREVVKAVYSGEELEAAMDELAATEAQYRIRLNAMIDWPGQRMVAVMDPNGSDRTIAYTTARQANG